MSDSKHPKSLTKDELLPVHHSEFMDGVTDNFSLHDLPTMSRKRFLALLAASTSFVAAGCTSYRDKGEIVPYTKKPEEIIPGIANFYSSTCTGCSQACGILIKTREGRPIKIDGNPDHPINRGKICARGQASILELYDPARLRGPKLGSSGDGRNKTWKEVDERITLLLDECVKAGLEIAIMTRAGTSPTALSVHAEFRKKYPTARLYSYEVFDEQNRLDAWEKCYGSRSLPVIDWSSVRIILSLDSDFLGTEGRTMEQTRFFANNRDVMKSSEFVRLYSVEGSMSVTGSNADYRLRLRPEMQYEFVRVLAVEVARATGFLKDLPFATPSFDDFAAKHDWPRDLLKNLIRDLISHQGQAIVIAGATLPPEVHVVVNYLNEILSNVRLYKEGEEEFQFASLSDRKEIQALVKRMWEGNVGAIFHVNSNPAFDFPRALRYEDALALVPVSVSMVEKEDETSARCTFVLPIHNALESWGDSNPRTGIFSLQQPVISPMYDSRQAESALLSWAAPETQFKESLYRDFVRQYWEKQIFPRLERKVDFEAFWYASLHDGVVQTSTQSIQPRRFKNKALQSLPHPTTSDGYVLQLIESYALGDGRFANNGWLQELPHPISKIVWDNYAAISSATAKELGVQNNDLVEVRAPHGTQILPVFVQPGQADRLVTVALGYGRWNAGPIGTDVGKDANSLLPSAESFGQRVLTGVSVRKTPGTYTLASTQEHHSLDDSSLKELHIKRKIIREGTIKEYLADPNFLQHDKLELFSISKEVQYEGLKWGMAIDLNKCTGCNICVSACNVENNIPVVGKEQTEKGREMHWIRIDRYFSGSEEAPLASHQPMLCQHCDNAPCENVCPVSATNHSPDGLNQMVYNRCVGTKYCSNNCPYKVRRFNFFDFRDHLADAYYEQSPVELVHNPEVTVRSRGVMEKCTFCVQRIAEARQRATEQGRSIRGTDVVTACQASCPAEAIIFGDVNDASSEISKYRNHNLGYHVLEELNVKPNVTYLARLRNIDSEKLS